MNSPKSLIFHSFPYVVSTLESIDEGTIHSNFKIKKKHNRLGKGSKSKHPSFPDHVYFGLCSFVMIKNKIQPCVNSILQKAVNGSDSPGRF